MRGIERARADLGSGNPRTARERLKGLLSTDPRNIEIRGLLAEAYRRDGQPSEAGRWGYLIGSAATPRERELFEEHCAFGWADRITEERLAHLLRISDLGAIADESGRETLRILPTKRRRRPRWPNGPFARLRRWRATHRSRSRWE